MNNEKLLFSLVTKAVQVFLEGGMKCGKIGIHESFLASWQSIEKGSQNIDFSFHRV